MPSSSAEVDGLVTEALGHLQAGRIPEATKALLSLKESGLQHPLIDANLGRLFAEQGSFGQSLPLLHSAIKMDRWDFGIRDSLFKAQSLVAGNMGTISRHPSEHGARIATYIHPAEAIWAGSLALLVGFLCALFKLRYLRSARNIFFACAATCFCLAGVGMWGSNFSIATQKTSARASPLASARVLNEFPEGSRLRVLRESGDFSEVERSGVGRGWIETKHLYMIK